MYGRLDFLSVVGLGSLELVPLQRAKLFINSKPCNS